MSDKQAFERVFEEALSIYALKDYDGLQKGKVRLSGKGKKRMKALIKSAGKKEHLDDEKKHAIKIAKLIMMAIIFMLMTSISVISASSYRQSKAMLKSASTSFGTRITTVSTQQGDAKDNDTLEFNPRLPEAYIFENTDYKMTSFNEYDFILISTWENEKGDKLELTQRDMRIDEYIEDKTVTQEYFEYDGLDYVYYTVNEKNKLLWSEFGYSFIIESEELNKDALLSISMKLEQTNGGGKS